MNSSSLVQKEKNYITKKGLERLQNEYDQLVRVERPEVTKTVAWAAGNGDRSENADYIYGKKRLREIDKRVRFLTQRIERAVVVDPSTINTDKVQFGATVTIIDLDDDQEQQKTISIVGVDEIETAKGLISWRSPLGSALIGKVVGDTIEVFTPKGNVSYEIVQIIYEDIS